MDCVLLYASPMRMGRFVTNRILRPVGVCMART